MEHSESVGDMKRGAAATKGGKYTIEFRGDLEQQTGTTVARIGFQGDCTWSRDEPGSRGAIAGWLHLTGVPAGKMIRRKLGERADL